MADERKPFGAWAPSLGDDPFAQLMASRGYSTDPLAQTQQGSQAVLNGLGTAGQFVAQPVLDAAHYADALNRGQANWDTTTGLGLGANMAMALWPFSRSGMLAKDAVEAGASAIPRVANPIRAYHGSPHDFDAFDLSKIGSGEGAQSYGHGLYFAEAEPTAKSYRDALALKNKGIDIAGSPTSQNDLTGAERQAWFMLANDRGDIDKSIARSSAAMNGEEVKAVLQNWKGRGVSFPQGHMYEVNIHADPEHFLDWDRPIANQPELIRDFFKTNDPFIRRGQVNPYSGSQDPTGNEAYRALGRWGDQQGWGLLPDRGERTVSKMMTKAGIPGIKYLDQGSRSAGQGTRNYVIFDPKIIEIMRKYGLAGPIAAAALNRPDDSQ